MPAATASSTLLINAYFLLLTTLLVCNIKLKVVRLDLIKIRLGADNASVFTAVIANYVSVLLMFVYANNEFLLVF